MLEKNCRSDSKTFTETAELAGISRVMGGYHIPKENIEGLKLGRNVGDLVFDRCEAYIKGEDRRQKNMD
jgi:hypothetical protein